MKHVTYHFLMITRLLDLLEIKQHLTLCQSKYGVFIFY